MRIGKRKLKGLLLLTPAIFGILTCAGDNIFQYLIILILIVFAGLQLDRFNITTPTMLFIEFYLFTVALGPLFLMNQGYYYNTYSYTKVILGGLLAFVTGASLYDIFFGMKEKNGKLKKEKAVLRFSFPRVYAIYALMLISYAASVYYLRMNWGILRGNINDGRITAMSGSGLYIQIIELHVILFPMLLSAYLNNKLYGNKKSRNKISKLILILLGIASSLSMFVTGFRGAIFLMVFCSILVYNGKKGIPQIKLIVIGIICIVAAMVMGVIRDIISGNSITFLYSLFRSMRNGAVNLNYVFRTFPTKLPFQHGSTYFINIKMLLPGPDLDFTLWLKEQVGISFSGGGLTPTVLGEFYMNFGYKSIFVGMFLLGCVSRLLLRYTAAHKGTFLSALYTCQFFHLVSGGIANIEVSILIYTILYKLLLMLPESGERRVDDSLCLQKVKQEKLDRLPLNRGYGTP